jgi:flagellar hook-associated protein 1 FlgK
VSGLFGLLNLGARSLNAAQFAQATVGNNAANSATPGFSRRRAQIVEGPVINAQIRVGSGVHIAGLQRIRDSLLDGQWRLDSEDLQFAKAHAGVLSQVGELFTPPDDNALISSLNAFFAAFGDVASRPEDTAARRVLVSQGQGFADAVRQAKKTVLGLESDTFTALSDRVSEVNGVAARLAALNTVIRQNQGDPSLLDERDRLVDRLSELIGVRATESNDGTVQVVVSGTGVQLVDGDLAGTLALTGAPTGGSVSVTLNGVTLAEPNGEIGGLFAARSSITDGLPYVLDSLDALARDVITAVNGVHASGSGLTLLQSVTGSVTVANPALPLAGAGLIPPPIAGTLTLGVFDSSGAFISSGTVTVTPSTMSLTALAAALDALPNIDASASGGKLVISAASAANRLAFGPDLSSSLVALGINGFFIGTDASTIAVSPELTGDPNLVAAAQADLTAGAVSPGDGRNARALAALAGADLATGGSQTAAEYLGALGGTLGAATRAASARATTLEIVVRAADDQRQSVAGVNLDEELADMVRYQHAFEASAKFIKTIDEMVSTLLGLVG